MLKKGATVKQNEPIIKSIAIKIDNFRMKKEFFLFDFVVAIFRKNLDVKVLEM